MRSIFFSLYQHFRTLSFLDAISDTLGAMHGIVRALLSRSRDKRILGAVRLKVCEDKCPFYNPKWKTCGTPGETMRGHPDGPFADSMKVGCWCYLPLANRDPKKDCWARAHGIVDGLPVGWPDVLRPTPISEEE